MNPQEEKLVKEMIFRHLTEKQKLELEIATLQGEMIGVLKGVLMYECVPESVKEVFKRRIGELEK